MFVVILVLLWCFLGVGGLVWVERRITAGSTFSSHAKLKFLLLIVLGGPFVWLITAVGCFGGALGWLAGIVGKLIDFFLFETPSRKQ